MHAVVVLVTLAATGCAGKDDSGTNESSEPCPPPEVRCDTVCTLVSEDRANCGDCGVSCAADQICQDGVCACPAGSLDCGSGCVDVTQDSANCGACDVRCAPDESCTSGACSTDAGGTGGGGTGGTSTGGQMTGGAPIGVGGMATGARAASGGSSSGGVSAGGSPAGGAFTGGAATGGVSSGGALAGGTTSGGVSAGGAPAGGGSSGGVPSGGASTGGIAGASSGGASTGGSGEGYLCDVGVWDGSPPALLDTGNQFAHDPTIVEADGTFHLYWTGDEIQHATSPNLRNWSSAPVVYNAGFPSWVGDWLNSYPGNSFNFPWAPDASYFNGQYHLYSSFSAFFGQNRSCITHLTTDDPSGSWTDHEPVICTDGSQDYNAIDADAGLDFEGNAYLAFGSFWGGIQMFPLNEDGSRSGNSLTHVAWASEIEAPVLFRRCGYYYLFVTWGLCCPGEGRSVNDLTYRVAVGRSESILGPYVDRNGTPMLDGGGTLLVEGDGINFAAAGHSDVLVSGETIYHVYHAYRQSNGAATMRIVELPFDDEGWPVPGGP